MLEKFSEGPTTGVFTDGGARPNPGPGGWGLVWVKDSEILNQKYGSDPDTTNNRMELKALIEALKILKDHTEEITVFTDSNLCVQTINQWAASWEKQGWRRKSGAIKNLELVQELYSLCKSKPNVKLQWVKAHNGWLWNEYADSLASAWVREEL